MRHFPILFFLFCYSFTQCQTNYSKYILKPIDGDVCEKGEANISVDILAGHSNSDGDSFVKLNDDYNEKSGHKIKWYDQKKNGVLLGVGRHFKTPVLDKTKNFFVSYGSIGGMETIQDDFKKIDGEGLMFDLYSPITINSVEVFSESSGRIMIEIAVFSKELNTKKSINFEFLLKPGVNKLELNCELPIGNNYVILAHPNDNDIKLSTIKNHQWPVKIGEFGSITSGFDKDGFGKKNRYCYFFNWDVSTSLVPVAAIVNKRTFNTTSITVCDEYTWEITGQSYSSSGIFSYDIGCHTEKLNLTIIPSAKKTEQLNSCDKFVWGKNGSQYNSSGTYYYKADCITNELVLTITPSTTNITTISAVDNYNWNVNNRKYDVSGTYTEVVGCVTERLVLNLTYTENNIPTSVLNNRSSGSKDWSNVYYNQKYTLFDLWSDEPILPDGNGVYHIWTASNESKVPIQVDINSSEISTNTYYKFKNYSNCKNWCDNIAYSESTPIQTRLKVNANQTFKQVVIGEQTWMKENLNISYFSNGDVIPQAKSKEEWENAAQQGRPAWCYYDFNEKNDIKYGKLYNWYAVKDARGLAPNGWHIPTDQEWSLLETTLGEKSSDKMKNSSGWNSYQTGGYSISCENCSNASPEYKKICPVCKGTQRSNKKTPVVVNSGNGSNSSGFSGLPGGYYINNFSSIGENGLWWSKTESDQKIYYRQLSHQGWSSSLYRGSAQKNSGISVRCVMNENCACEWKVSEGMNFVSNDRAGSKIEVGNKFRAYVNEEFPEIASKYKLEASGSKKLDYCTKAMKSTWNHVYSSDEFPGLKGHTIGEIYTNELKDSYMWGCKCVPWEVDNFFIRDYNTDIERDSAAWELLLNFNDTWDLVLDKPFADICQTDIDNDLKWAEKNNKKDLHKHPAIQFISTTRYRGYDEWRSESNSESMQIRIEKSKSGTYRNTSFNKSTFHCNQWNTGNYFERDLSEDVRNDRVLQMVVFLNEEFTEILDESFLDKCKCSKDMSPLFPVQIDNDLGWTFEQRMEKQWEHPVVRWIANLEIKEGVRLYDEWIKVKNINKEPGFIGSK
jgi:uncharacterized protein (TIGR02145 family)